MTLFKKTLSIIMLACSFIIFAACTNDPLPPDDDDDDPIIPVETYHVKNGGFETGNLSDWTVISGEAFEEAGVSSLSNDVNFNVPYNKDGTFFYGRHKEDQEGILRSSTFEVGGVGKISFKLGGGKNVALNYISIKDATTHIELHRFGHTNFNSDISNSMANYREANLVLYVADISQSMGKNVYIEIVDQSKREWGLMLFDSFVTYYKEEPTFDTFFEAEDIKPTFTLSNPQATFDNYDFTSGLDHWTVAYGSDAFQASHVKLVNEHYRLINRSNESAIGVLRSDSFKVDGLGLISFRLGSMQQHNRENLYVSVKMVGTNQELYRTYNNRGKTSDEEGTHLYYVDLVAYQGMSVYLEIVDNTSENWGLVIFEQLDTYYDELPNVKDEVALNLINLGKTERQFTIMRGMMDAIIEDFNVEALIANIPNESTKQFYRDHFKEIFEKTFYSTIDGFTVNSPKAGTLHFGSVNHYLEDGTTFTLTGDIPAMWLRDSSAQILQYLHFINEDEDVKGMVKGIILRLFMYIRMDPYANAFNQDGSVWERKFEIDSLCYPVWLAYQYYKLTGDDSIFDVYFQVTVNRILETFYKEQNHSDSNYDIWTISSNDKNKYPNAVATNIGLIWNGYRPSDDVTKYKYLIPSNMFAVVILRQLHEIYTELEIDEDKAVEILALADEVDAAILEYGTYDHPTFGKIYAYEVDGLGNYNLMDDANIPSLLSAPWLGYLSEDDVLYQNTRAFLLSSSNPYYFEGIKAKGIGSEHTPANYVWPMALVMQSLTSDDEAEQLELLTSLVLNTAGTFVMHEGFNVNDSDDYSREWFTWPCALFSDMVLIQYVLNAE